ALDGELPADADDPRPAADAEPGGDLPRLHLLGLAVGDHGGDPGRADHDGLQDLLRAQRAAGPGGRAAGELTPAGSKGRGRETPAPCPGLPPRRPRGTPRSTWPPRPAATAAFGSGRNPTALRSRLRRGSGSVSRRFRRAC